MNPTPVLIADVTMQFDRLDLIDLASYLEDLGPGLGPDIISTDSVDTPEGGRTLHMKVRVPYTEPLKAMSFLGAQLSNSLRHCGLREPTRLTCSIEA